jgi:hypothetical protein
MDSICNDVHANILITSGVQRADSGERFASFFISILFFLSFSFFFIFIKLICVYV